MVIVFEEIPQPNQLTENLCEEKRYGPILGNHFFKNHFYEISIIFQLIISIISRMRIQ